MKNTSKENLPPIPTNTVPIPSQPLHTLYFPHPRVTAPVGEHSMAVQSAKAECDINNILSQYRRTGIITHVSNARPTYEDLPDPMDYQQSMNLLINARQAFAALPAKVRDHFGNEPVKLLQALQDPNQADQLREFGILNPLPPKAPESPPGE